MISEDTIRYLFYACVIDDQKLSKNEYEKLLQEVPYTDKRLNVSKNTLNDNTELDSYFEFGDKKYAIEFKFHRKISKNGNKKQVPETMNAGNVFNDINRLSTIKGDVKKYFVYLMDKSMMNYKEKKKNSIFYEVFNLYEYESIIIKPEAFDDEPKTFKKYAHSSFLSKCKFKDIYITVLKSIPIDNGNYCLKILEIHSDKKSIPDYISVMNQEKIIRNKYKKLARNAYSRAINKYHFKYDDLFRFSERTPEKAREILTNTGRLALLDMEQNNPLRNRKDFNNDVDYIIYLSQMIWFCAGEGILPDSRNYEYVNPYLF